MLYFISGQTPNTTNKFIYKTHDLFNYYYNLGQLEFVYFFQSYFCYIFSSNDLAATPEPNSRVFLYLGLDYQM